MTPTRLLLLSIITYTFVACELFAEKTGFTLEDHLNRTWQNEAVRFPISGSDLKNAKADKALVGPDGKAVPYQLLSGATKRDPMRIEFLADLNPFETRAYAFTGSKSGAQTDLQLEETDHRIRVSNHLTGISIRRTLKNGEGPIEAIRLNSGKWIGTSSITSTAAVTSCSTEVVARGPVFAEVSCRVEFATGRPWKLRFRLQANEPVVLVEESFSTQDDSAFVLSPGPNFSPGHLLYRTGKGRCGQISAWKIAAGDPEPAFVLEPWLHWWERVRQGQWFGLYNESDPDLLAIAAYGGDEWIDPARKDKQSSAKVLATLEQQTLNVTFPLREGCRKWMIASLNKEASLAMLNEKDLFRAPPPQQYLIKHGQFPLDRVKDYALDWPARVEDHPRLFLRKADLPTFRKNFKVDPVKLAECIKRPVSFHLDGDHIAYYLATGNPELGRGLATNAVDWIRGAVDMYLKQDAVSNLGFAPHHQTQILVSLNLADAVMVGDALSPEMIQRLRAQIAFLGYTVNRPDYWSPEHGFSANPNMTTTVASFRTAIACMISSHPMAATWFKHGMAELKDVELDTWSDANGGWLEAPHYAMVSYDYLLGCFLMARNSGMADHLYHPKMKKIAEWFAKISTPPDSRVAGRRHRPPIGNSYLGEPTGEFGTLAYLWKDRDPKFASEMQWMHRQQGSFPAPGIGGFFPTLAGYRKLLFDPTIPAKAPAYKSELFPETGVVLRNTYPSDRETMLYLIAGNNNQHYDYDSGSITLWGKGRIVADDFGYYGRAPVDDHNMVETPLANAVKTTPKGYTPSTERFDYTRMRVKEFAPFDRFDYVRGVCNGWTRQIVFIKDVDPLAPNYFVVCDTLNETAPATWRLWLTASKVTAGSQNALVEGKEDVDTDVCFLLPNHITLKTEERTRRSGSGLFPDGHWGPMDSTQTGLIASLQSGLGFTAVIYPRLKTEKPPVFTTLAEGKAVKVQSDAGTDHVFLAAAPFSFNDDGLAFEGTSGAAQIRGGRIVLSLGAAGSISAEGNTLKSNRAATREYRSPR